MGRTDEHRGTRRSGEQGDGTLVLGHIASGQPEGAQPRVAVTSVLCIIQAENIPSGQSSAKLRRQLLAINILYLSFF